MREVISIHVGQAGVQWGNACWELYCLGTCSSHIFPNPDSTNLQKKNPKLQICPHCIGQWGLL